MFLFPIDDLFHPRNISRNFIPRNPNIERDPNQFEMENDYEPDSNDNESSSNNEKLNEINGNFKSLEYLLSIPEITNSDNDIEEEKKIN